MTRLRRIAAGLVAVVVSGCHRRDINKEINKEIARSVSSEGVRFTAEASIPPDNPDTVFLKVIATNRSGGYRSVFLSPSGRCGPSVGFVTGRGKVTRVWRLEWPRMQLPPGAQEVCIGSAAAVHFPPGASVDAFRASVPIRTILGDSLPPGLYRAVIGGNAKLQGGYVTREIPLR